MIPQRSPLIQVGQVYLHEDLDEYLIVTKNNRGCIHYSGTGGFFKGHADDQSFIERFLPVDPEDVDMEELLELLVTCPEGTTAKVGFIMDESSEEEEEVQ